MYVFLSIILYIRSIKIKTVCPWRPCMTLYLWILVKIHRFSYVPKEVQYCNRMNLLINRLELMHRKKWCMRIYRGLQKAVWLISCVFDMFIFLYDVGFSSDFDDSENCESSKHPSPLTFKGLEFLIGKFRVW